MASTEYEAITVSDTAIGFSESLISAISYRKPIIEAFCTVEGAQIRYTYNGTTPTSTVGHLAEVGDVYAIRGLNDVLQFRAIRTGTTNATLHVTYDTD